MKKRIRSTQISLSLLAGMLFPEPMFAAVQIANGGSLRVDGILTATDSVNVLDGGTLYGNGTVHTEIIEVQQDGFLSPGVTVGSIQTSATLLLDGVYQYDINDTSADSIVVSGSLDISRTTLEVNLISALEQPDAFIIARYDTLLGSSFDSIIGRPSGYTLDYAYDDGSGSNNIAFVAAPESYVSWALGKGLEPGINDGFEQDPNLDGDSNIIHFALDSDPLATGIRTGKRRELVQWQEEQGYLTLTLPVRSDAVFSGSGLSPSLQADGVVYILHGDSDLTAPHDLVIQEVSPALSSGLPALNTGYSYRTFRIAESLTSEPSTFIILEVSPGS